MKRKTGKREKVQVVGGKVKRPDTSDRYKMPENFRWKLECKSCKIYIDANGHYTMAEMDAWLSGHIKAFKHSQYDLKIYDIEVRK